MCSEQVKEKVVNKNNLVLCRLKESKLIQSSIYEKGSTMWQRSDSLIGPQSHRCNHDQRACLIQGGSRIYFVSSVFVTSISDNPFVSMTIKWENKIPRAQVPAKGT